MERRIQRSFLHYAILRVAEAIPLIFIVLVINFLLIHLAPGDPVLVLIGPEGNYDPAYIATLRAAYGIDQPLYVQLVLYIEKMLRGDLGTSITYGLPVSTLIAERVPATAILIGTSIVLAAIFGIILGIVSASKPYSLIDNFTTSLSLAGYSLPTFWEGQVLLIVFAVSLGILPAGGLVSVGTQMSSVELMTSYLRHLVLPVVTLATSRMALISRLTRAGMLETLNKDFILTARAKGVPKRRVLFNHAFRNACLPVVTILGLEFGFLLAGAVVTETVFAWPGLGRLMFLSIKTRDYPLLMGMFFVISVSVILANLFVDLIYTRLDPRVRAT